MKHSAKCKQLTDKYYKKQVALSYVQPVFLWALTDSNRRPFRFYRNALNQLYINIVYSAYYKKQVALSNVQPVFSVGVDGFEPPTLPILSECSEPAIHKYSI